MTVLEVPATELVSIADEVGCEFVCVFVHVPFPNLPFGPVTPELAPELRARTDATGVAVTNVEFFVLTPEVEIESFRPAVELGAEIGGGRLVTLVHDTDRARATDSLARLCALAAEHGLEVGIEFMPRAPGCPTIEAASELVRRVDAANLGFAVDPLHLVRSGGTPADVAAQPAELFAYAQICDGLDFAVGPDYREEVFERALPGEGVFPLAAFVDALPAATPVDVEVPSRNGLPPLDRARRAAAAARTFLGRANPSR
jgi:sugar phosphate isomerase/epimerase